MRTFLLVFAIAVSSLTAFSQKKQTDLEFEGLKGKVKSVQVSTIYLETKEKPTQSSERRYQSIKSYDLDGDIIEELDSNRGVKHVYQLVDGFWSMKEVVVDKEKARMGVRIGSIGNAEGMEKPVKTIKPDERFITRFEFEYDEKGRRILRRIFFSNGKMDSISHYTYNSAALLEKYVNNSYGDKWTHFYTYDADGNLKEDKMERSDAKDVIDMVTRTEYSDYKFDAKGNWIERKYKYQSEYEGKTTVSEAIEYRDIKYHDAGKPKK